MIDKFNLTAYIWLLPFFCFLFGFYITYRSTSHYEFAMPLLVGKSLFECMQLTSDYNLNMRIHSYKVDRELSEGTILWQSPQVGQKVKSQQTVLCTLSSLPTPAQLPDFKGKSLEEIKKIITEHNIPATIHFIKKAGAKTCFAQYPDAHTRIPNTSVIVYMVHTEPLHIIMPRFTGHPLQKVQEFLKSYAIPTTIIHEKNILPDHRCDCSVKAQKPLAGSIISLERIGSIQLQVS